MTRIGQRLSRAAILTAGIAMIAATGAATADAATNAAATTTNYALAGTSRPTAVAPDYANNRVFATADGTNSVYQFNNATALTPSTPTAYSTTALPNMANPASVAVNNRLGTPGVTNFCFYTAAPTSLCSATGSAATSIATNASSGFNTAPAACNHPSGIAISGDTTAAASDVAFFACVGTGSSGGSLWVTSAASNSVTQITGLTLSAPSGVAFNTAAPYVTDGGNGVNSSPAKTPDSAVIVADAVADKVYSVYRTGGGAVTVSAPASLPAGCKAAQVAVGAAQVTRNSLSGTGSDYGSSAPVYVACPGTSQVAVFTTSHVTNTTTTVPATTITAGTPITLTAPANGATPRPFGVAANNRSGSYTPPAGKGVDSVAYGSASPSALVVSDFANNRALVYTLTTNGTTVSGTPVSHATESGPVGVADIGNNAFVANRGSNSISVFDPPADVAKAKTCALKAKAKAKLVAKKSHKAMTRAAKRKLAKAVKTCYSLAVKKIARKPAAKTRAVAADTTPWWTHPLYP